MKIRKFDILLLLCFILFLIAGLWAYGRACQRAAAVLRDPGAAVLSNAAVSALTFSASPLPADSRESIGIPILMYHGITDNDGKENDYFIRAERLESDLKWLRDNGYTTILPSRLIAYAAEGAKLPRKPVILSFDDGYCNNYTYAFPLLQQYQAKAVIALIGADCARSSDDIYRVPASCALSWGEVALMSRSGLVEFASHTYDLHRIRNGRKGADRKKGEDFETYARLLREDSQKNQTLITAAAGKPPQVFAWPYGAYPMDGAADSTLKALGMQATFTSYQRTSVVRRGDADSLYGLGRYLRTPRFDITKITENASG